jgi:hypothetical protein
LYLPFWQGEHSMLDSSEKVPSAQLKQADSEFDPSCVLNFPPMQLVQEAEEDFAAYLPVEHNAQVTSSVCVEKRPGMQASQGVIVPSYDLAFPASQEMQEGREVKLLYLPISHRLHSAAPFSEAYFPAKQSEHD